MPTTGYAPTVRRGSTVYQLPLPLLSSDERFGQDVRSSKVPLQNGIIVSNIQLQAAEVQFSGVIVVSNPQDRYRAGAVSGMVTDTWIEKTRLITYLLANQLAMTKFYIFSSGTKYWYENCICTSLQFSNSSRTVKHLPYSFTLLVPDGKLHTGT